MMISQYEELNKTPTTSTISSHLNSDICVFLHSAKAPYTVAIIDTERHGNEYVEYLIKVTPYNNTDGKDTDIGSNEISATKPWIVFRRYSDFCLLKTSLEYRLPYCLIPPLPEKSSAWNWTVGSRKKFDPEFVETRKILLGNFLTRLLNHPKLSHDEVFKKFLLEGNEWKELVNNPQLRERMSRYLERHSAVLRIKNSCPIVSQLKTESKLMQENIHNVLQALNRVQEQRINVHKLHKNFGEIFSDWCQITSPLSDSLQTISHLVDSYTNLMDKSESELGEFELRLREYMAYCETLQQLCRRQEVCQLEMEKKSDLVNHLKNDLEVVKHQCDSVVKNGLKQKLTRQKTDEDRHKIEESLEKQIERQESELQKLQSDLLSFADNISVEYSFFNKQRSKEIAASLEAFCRYQLASAQRSQRIWTQCRDIASPALQQSSDNISTTDHTL